jgi:hypothetical protein
VNGLGIKNERLSIHRAKFMRGKLAHGIWELLKTIEGEKEVKLRSLQNVRKVVRDGKNIRLNFGH